MGALANLDPTLILAVMAVESSFNPFAQSPVGAQGLMQVMTKVHDDKYEAFGGTHAAFDPVTNLRVGVQVLKECIARARQPRSGPALLCRRRQPAKTAATRSRCSSSSRCCVEVAGGAKVRTRSVRPPAAATPQPRSPRAPVAGGRAGARRAADVRAASRGDTARRTGSPS